MNDKMDDFGGILIVRDGEIVNLVEDSGAPRYRRRAHGRKIRAA